MEARRTPATQTSPLVSFLSRLNSERGIQETSMSLFCTQRPAVEEQMRLRRSSTQVLPGVAGDCRHLTEHSVSSDFTKLGAERGCYVLFKISLFYQKPLQEVINFKGKLNFSSLLFPETSDRPTRGTVYVTQSPGVWSRSLLLPGYQ